MRLSLPSDAQPQNPQGACPSSLPQKKNTTGNTGRNGAAGGRAGHDSGDSTRWKIKIGTGEKRVRKGGPGRGTCGHNKSGVGSGVPDWMEDSIEDSPGQGTRTSAAQCVCLIFISIDSANRLTNNNMSVSVRLKAQNASEGNHDLGPREGGVMGGAKLLSGKNPQEECVFVLEESKILDRGDRLTNHNTAVSSVFARV